MGWACKQQQIKTAEVLYWTSTNSTLSPPVTEQMCSSSLASQQGYILQLQPTAVDISTFATCLLFFFPSLSNLLPFLFSLLLSCLYASGKTSAGMSFSISLSVSAACCCSFFSTMESSSSLIPTVEAPKYLLFSQKDDAEPQGPLYHHRQIYINLNFIFCYPHDSPTLMIVSTLNMSGISLTYEMSDWLIDLVYCLVGRFLFTDSTSDISDDTQH